MIFGKVWLCDKPWWQASVAAALFFSALGYSIWSETAQVLDFGAAGKTYLVPDEVVAGQRAQICLADTVWRRICPSITTYYTTWTDASGVSHRLDADSPHIVAAPSSPQRLPVKCRPIIIQPELPVGNMTMHFWSVSHCPPLGNWRDIISNAPDIHFKVKPK